MVKDYILTIVDDETGDVVNHMRLYEEHHAETIAKKYVMDGQTAFVSRLLGMFVKIAQQGEVPEIDIKDLLG